MQEALSDAAAGVTWTSRTAKAPWAARYGHTTVIDAAGAIYVIGGYNGAYLADVYVSTDGGADRTRMLPGCQRDSRGTNRYLGATEGVLEGH